MAVIGFEGFDNWNNTFSGVNTICTNPIAQGLSAWGWGTLNFNQLVAGTLGGKKILNGAGNVCTVNFPVVTSPTQIVLGFRFTASVAVSQQLCRFLDSAAAIQCGLELNASQKLIVWRGTNATVLGTGTTVIVAGAEYYVEIKIGFSNSDNVEVRLNGVSGPPEITLSGVDTTNTANNNVNYVVFAPTAGGLVSIDDVYLLDTTSSAPQNNFLGIIRVETLFGTSNNSVQWTPNASTNVSRINETAVDQDTSYNSDSVNGHIDTFNHGSLVSTPVTIFSAKVQSFVRKEDVSNRTYRNKQISNVTTSNGTTYAVTTLYMTYEDYYTNDPDTGVAWLAAGINATKYGYEVVS